MKCSCGHMNPIGIVLCENCGKPQKEVHQDTFLKEMRYEGRMRKSRDLNNHVVGFIWRFLSSVKVAVFLILLTLVMAGVGTLLPQEKFIPSLTPHIYYVEHYGIWGKLYYLLGLSRLYEAWWFISLLVLIGSSLIVCSLDRVLPLYRALNKQSVIKDISFITKQKIFYEKKEPKEILDQLSEKLTKMSYAIHREKDSLLAEKGRLSRWGPYVNHIGLIIFLIGLLCSYIPGWYLDESVWVREGEVKKVPKTPYYIQSKKAFVEFHENTSVVKNYQTNAVLLKKDGTRFVELVKHPIQVNHPLKYKDLNLFQSDFRYDEVKSITLRVENKKKKLGTFTIDLGQMVINKDIPISAGTYVKIIEYYPNFAFDPKRKRPITRSNQPNRPAFVVELNVQGKKEVSWVISGQKFEIVNPDRHYHIRLDGLQFHPVSGLMVRIDKRLPILFFGGMITMIGLILGFYWQHRRVWITWKDGSVYIGAHTNKNWFMMQTELNRLIPLE